MDNIYYSPEQYGLVQIYCMDDPQASYSFDYLVAWKHTATNMVYWAQDSGCSCPSPFEDYHSLSDLNNIHDGSWDAFEQAVMNHCATLGDKEEMIRRVKEELYDLAVWVRSVRAEDK